VPRTPNEFRDLKDTSKINVPGVIQIEKFAHREAASTGEFLDHHTSARTGYLVSSGARL
jgi:hypothetical protein